MRRFVLGLAGFVLVGSALAQQPAFDLLLENGRVVDGTGAPWFVADVAIQGDTIVAIGRDLPGTARRSIDVHGAVIAPGFIDLHSHARRGILKVPTADNYVRQGVTTLVEGPDGSSPLPLKPFLDEVAALKTTPNFASFVGQGTIRESVIGRGNRRATAAEIEKMKELVRSGMRDGAFGLSSGLFYVPGTFTPTDEVIELAKVAGSLGGIYISHMRNEAKGVLDSVLETIRIGEEGRLPAQVTHHKIIGTGNWGKSVDTLAAVDVARARGVDVTIDQYPYTASSTTLAALLPAWALEGAQADVVKRLADPATRDRIRATVVENIRFDRGGGDPRNVQIAACGHDPSLAGKRLDAITRAAGRELTLENAAETALEIVEKGGASAIFHAIDEADLVRILKHPATMIASDGEVTSFGVASPHPRSYGTWVRVLGRYVREQHVVGLEEAVRKMTAMPAARLRLPDRGLLRPGMKADIAVFDPETVADRATFEAPHQYAVGVPFVVVNGALVVEDGRMTGARPGRVLWGPATAK